LVDDSRSLLNITLELNNISRIHSNDRFVIAKVKEIALSLKELTIHCRDKY